MVKRYSCWLVLWSLGVSPSLYAVNIEGVLNASLDQPRINAAIRLPGDNAPLSGTGQDQFGDLFGDLDDLFGDLFGDRSESFNIVAFFDTGASGILVSESTAATLGLPRQPGITFADVGVGGSEEFEVSQDVFVHLAPFTANASGIDDPSSFESTYDQSFGVLQTQIGPSNADENNLLLGGLDVFGMPLFTGKTVVMDVRPANQLLGTIDTLVLNSGAPLPGGVPEIDRHIQMSYGSFERFTRTFRTEPGGDEVNLDQAIFGPTLNHNPFIGPDPVAVLEDSPANGPPGITVKYNDLSSTGSWLFDTGAAASIMSREQAANLGVTYVDGTYATDFPILNGVPANEQFTLTIGGIGGSLNVAGLFLDRLVISTVEGDPIRFDPAPVLIADIRVLDPITLDQLTLDGVFGMNFLVSSAFIDGFSLPTEIRAGAFDWLIFDEPSGQLGLVLNPALVPEPTTISCLTLLALILLHHRPIWAKNESTMSVA